MTRLRALIHRNPATLTAARALATPIRRLSSRGRILVAAAGTMLRRTNVARWKRNVHENPHWDARNVYIASLIPDRSSVLDLGAGAQTLRGHLKPGCRYQPCDLVRSSPDVILCDFNRRAFPNLAGELFDYVVCSGVLEYIRQPEEFIAHIRHYGRRLIVTYNVRLDGDSIIDRLACDWINHMTQGDLDRLFSGGGLTARLLTTRLRAEQIFELTAGGEG